MHRRRAAGPCAPAADRPSLCAGGGPSVLVRRRRTVRPCAPAAGGCDAPGRAHHTRPHGPAACSALSLPKAADRRRFAQAGSVSPSSQPLTSSRLFRRLAAVSQRFQALPASGFTGGILLPGTAPACAGFSSAATSFPVRATARKAARRATLWPGTRRNICSQGFPLRPLRPALYDPARRQMLPQPPPSRDTDPGHGAHASPETPDGIAAGIRPDPGSLLSAAGYSATSATRFACNPQMSPRKSPPQAAPAPAAQPNAENCVLSATHTTKNRSNPAPRHIKNPFCR